VLTEPRIGDFLCAHLPVDDKYRMGIIVDIVNRYPVDIPETKRYTIRWFDTGAVIPNCKFEYVFTMRELYERAMQQGLLEHSMIDFGG